MDHQKLPLVELKNEPTAGNYFVSTYPPFSCWSSDAIDEARQVLNQSIDQPQQVPWGLYVHIPFCSQRCDFCYYRSYESTSRQTMEAYVSTLLQEIQIVGALPVVQERPLLFVYFGGGTPSLLPLKQLNLLMGGIRDCFSWDAIEEVTFECAPKTATRDKLDFLRQSGVTRISMGIQQLNDEILKLNGRIHSARDARRAYGAIRDTGFPQVNVDLIVGLVGETDDTFFKSLDDVMELEPDSITIYQLEIPPNTPLFRSHSEGETIVPDWDTKRRRLNQAFDRLNAAGYHNRSAYTLVRDKEKHHFVYQEAQYRGVDLIGTGIASFSYVQGVHYQNLASLGSYRDRIDACELPISRGYRLNDDERLVRQFVLQLKLGCVPLKPLDDEFGISTVERFAEPLAQLAAQGLLLVNENTVRLTRSGLLCVDRILPSFFSDQHQAASYW